ncbi:hypothetical protein [Hydrogenovibrio kuenenii]|uniref:hypothetical protein n=1 Tax=Hydrogenovibrio kuenenii TaxID=63658 RepID=UPI0004668A2D|nr:hypothetical protein [Hydrogenovibrio kuenenii]
MTPRQRRHAQQGSISLLGVLSIFVGLTALVGVMQLGNATILDRHLDNYAQSLAPVALRSEVTLSKAMVDNGVSINVAKDTLQKALDAVTEPGSVKVNISFGNITNGKFTPLTSNPSNPKAGLSATATVPGFAAVAVQFIGPSTFGFVPEGRAIYGLTDQDQDSPDVASCYCDARYDQCLQQPSTNSAMGGVDTKERQRYCETGIAPSVSGGMMGMFFGGDPEYPDADSVQFSPQWVGKPYENGTVKTDTGSSAWQAVKQDAPLNVSSGNNPFPEASWDPATEDWKEGNFLMQFTGYKNVSTLFGSFKKYKNPWKVDGTFYAGRSGTCAYPSNGFFFFGVMSDVQTYMTGNTDCLRYTANPASKYDYANFMQPFMNAINSSTGANQHYYSCRDFTGLQSSRSGVIQIMRRIWTSPLQVWDRTYRETGCSAKQMRWFSSSIWNGW